MPLIETKGAASAQGFGEFAQQTAATYIEDVFSTYLYTGNGSTQTITNGIDLSGKGGLVWLKARTQQQSNETYGGHALYDTVRGATKQLSTSDAAAETTESTGLTSFNSTGFNIGSLVRINNSSSYNYVSWSFRKQLKFFDVVTYTGNGIAGRTVAHNLGSVPGCIIIKQYSGTESYTVYHRSLGSTAFIRLDQAAAAITAYNPWNSTTPTAGVFTLGTQSAVNASGSTYVAYLFAHDAGGFGLTGSDNVVSCGSFSVPGGIDADITLGYEPQWVLVKSYDNSSNWVLTDNMRGMFVTTSLSSPTLLANTTNAENANSSPIVPTSTGFNVRFTQLNGEYIYIAIRRGPMKVPTSGTSVFTPATRTGTGSGITTTAAGFPVDTYFVRRYPSASFPNDIMDRLRGSPSLVTNSTGIESAGNGQVTSWAAMSGVGLGSDGETNSGISPDNLYIDWYFRRAPGFFDGVCYTGNGTSLTVNHNLTVVPELVIAKQRNASTWPWVVYHKDCVKGLYLNLTGFYPSDDQNIDTLTATTFRAVSVAAASTNYVAYLFATCAGVSKVGSYTGTGALQTVNCGFTGGARFVLIRRSDSTGDWYVYDSARGISSGTDPYLVLNSNAAQVTGTNYVDTTSVGFQVTAAAPAGLNANGGTYIFLAIA